MRMWSRFASGLEYLGVSASLLGAVANTSSAQRSIDISGPPSCAQCTIALDSIVTLGGRTEREGIIAMIPQVARDHRGRFFLGPTAKPGQIVLYDSVGHPIGSIGDTGAVHFSAVSRIWLDGGDSLHVFDGNRRLETVLPPELRPIRTAPVGGDAPNDIVFLPSGSSIRQARIGGAGFGLPVHLVGPDGVIRRSFGADVPLVEHGNPYLMYGAIAAAPNAGVWVGNFTQYRFDLLDTTGTLRARVTRHASFYPTWSGRTRGTTAFGVRQDPAGYLWVLIDDESHGSGGPLQTIIEVLDPATARVVSSRTVDGFFWRFFAGDYTARTIVLPDGTAVTEVFRVRLENPNARAGDRRLR